MNSILRADYSTEHAGIHRVQAAYAATTALGRGFTGAKGLHAMLLGAGVAALVVLADQAIDTWADEHLMAAWVALWAVAFIGLGLLSGGARKLATRSVNALNAWSARTAQGRADARLWEVAQRDPRILAEITRAMADAVPEAVAAPQPAYTADAARGANTDLEIEAFQHRRRRRMTAPNGQ